MWKTLADRALIDSRRLHIGLTRKWAAEGCDFIKKNIIELYLMMLVLSFMQYCYHRFMFSKSKTYPKEVSIHLFHVHYYKRTRQIDMLWSLQLCVIIKSQNVFIFAILKFHFLIICNLQYRHFAIRSMKLL